MSLNGDPGRPLGETVKGEACIAFGDARVVGHLPRRAADGEWKQPRRKELEI